MRAGRDCMKGLHIRNLKKKYNDFELGPIDMDVDAGYIVAVIGRNGCGKSTLFNCLLGTEKADGECGWISEDDEDVKKHFAFILERCPFPKDYTPTELYKCFGSFYEGFDGEKYYDVLRRYNIPQGKPLEKLSRGNIMVVQMAFAFAYKSEVLFLDEPSAHLDSYAREELYKLVSDYEDEGHIIFWASHVMEELDRMADYVLAIKKGQQVYFGTKEELTERYHIVKGSRNQLDYMQKALVGRRDEESFSVGVIDTSKDYLKLAPVDEPAGLGDIVEYLL